MICEWCTKREAKWLGLPVVGPESRMCDPCRDRLCQRDEKGEFVAKEFKPEDIEPRMGANVRE